MGRSLTPTWRPFSTPLKYASSSIWGHCFIQVEKQKIKFCLKNTLPGYASPFACAKKDRRNQMRWSKTLISDAIIVLTQLQSNIWSAADMKHVTGGQLCYCNVLNKTPCGTQGVSLATYSSVCEPLWLYIEHNNRLFIGKSSAAKRYDRFLRFES